MKKILIFLGAWFLGVISAAWTIHKMPRVSSADIDKWKTYYFLYDRWLSRKQQQLSLSSWFEDRGYYNIAVYGARELGARICQELKDTNINVAYLIDKSPENSLCREFSVFKPNADLEKVDIIVISAVFYKYEIKKELKSILPYNVVSLDEIIYGTTNF